MKKRKKILIICGVILTVIIAIISTISVNKKNMPLNIRTQIVSRDSIQITVTATGYVQPVYKVEVGTQVSGVIEKIYADYNSQVKKGQLLAELDKLTLREKLNQANASLNSSESELVFAQQNYNRVKQLYDANAETLASYEDAINRLQQAKTSVANAKANVHQAEVNLSYAYIYSPINGVVLSRDVDEGQTVAASFNTPTLFTIANDLTKMQVEANVDEADIGKVRVGQKVSFYVDAYNDHVFEGTVRQIRLQPTVSNNVVTYTVIINAPNPEEKLFPGMTANITIVTDTDKGPAIQVAAFNFRPNSSIAKKMGISEEDLMSINAKKSVWVKQKGQYKQKKVKTGLSDGVSVIIKYGLEPGEEVVISANTTSNKTGNSQEAVSNPLMPNPPKRK